MPISKNIVESMNKSSWIRKMFEEGIKLRAKFGEDNVFDFSLGNPDLPPPPEFFTAISGICSSNKKEKTVNEHGYMPNAGYLETREAVAVRVLIDHGVSLKAENIIMTCGAAGGLNVVLKTLLNPGEEVIVPKPFFAEYGAYVGNHNGKITYVDTNADFSLNIEKINAAISSNTKAILINSPNNPTGKVYSEKDIKELAGLLNAQAKNHGRIIYLISDEPYRELVYNGVKVPSILGNYSNSILVTSYSKTLSIAGERLGFIAVNPMCDDVCNLLAGIILCNRILGFVNAPALMQKILPDIINIKVNINIYKKRRDIFVTGLKNSGYEVTEPEGAFYIFPKSPIKDDVEFVKHLQKYNVLVVPGVGFGGPGYFRISYAVPENVIKRSIPKFKEALEAL
ncbi:MAG: pyridoxal phosphate-dependent aminotransferase [Spirochaetota bacterium]